MTGGFALVFWTDLRKTSVLPVECFEKSFKKNGKEVPLDEGTLRAACFEGKRYEGKILRLCPTKKYLESLLVTQDGQILLHGSKPSSEQVLARKLKLYDDDTEEKKAEKSVLWALNKNAEEQPPNTRLDGGPNCTSGCSKCCKRKLPLFPALPEGFIPALRSLAEYFHQFHKSTAANILAAASALANVANHLDSFQADSWQYPSHNKVELKKGSGVWIDPDIIPHIIVQSEIRRPPTQALVKSMLLNLLGMEKYLKINAENMDRRLLSTVVGYANEKYPEHAQPIERYYRCINLNRNYLSKKSAEELLHYPFGKGNPSQHYRRTEVPKTIRKAAENGSNMSGDQISKKPRISIPEWKRIPGHSNQNSNIGQVPIQKDNIKDSNVHAPGSNGKEIPVPPLQSFDKDRNISTLQSFDSSRNSYTVQSSDVERNTFALQSNQSAQLNNRKIIVLHRGNNTVSTSSLQSNSQQFLSSVLNTVNLHRVTTTTGGQSFVLTRNNQQAAIMPGNSQISTSNAPPNQGVASGLTTKAILKPANFQTTAPVNYNSSQIPITGLNKSVSSFVNVSSLSSFPGSSASVSRPIVVNSVNSPAALGNNLHTNNTTKQTALQRMISSASISRPSVAPAITNQASTTSINNQSGEDLDCIYIG